MNKPVLSLESKKKDYLRKLLIFGAIGVGLLYIGGIFVYAYYENLRRGYNEASFFLVGGAVAIVGAFFMDYALGMLSKYRKAKDAFLQIGTETVEGCVGGRTFRVPVAQIASTAVNICSVKTDYNGTPEKMEVNGMMKMMGRTNPYLTIFTEDGKVYYLDCVAAPEKAKTTIDSLVQTAKSKVAS